MSYEHAGGAVCREYESEAPAAEESMLDRVIRNIKFSDVP